jgi:hypothetical protein
MELQGAENLTALDVENSVCGLMYKAHYRCCLGAEEKETTPAEAAEIQLIALPPN